MSKSFYLRFIIFPMGITANRLLFYLAFYKLTLQLTKVKFYIYYFILSEAVVKRHEVAFDSSDC